jgi:hypothetical protein
VVLNENQRTAKKQLIKVNRERKEIEKIREHLKATAFNESVTDDDRALVGSITESYCRTIDGEVFSCYKNDETSKKFQRTTRPTEPQRVSAWQSVITPLIKLCIDFAKGVPLFRQVLVFSF